MFRVEWDEAALDELATIWLQADAVLRRAITAANAAIDRQLQRDPEGQGESRPEANRIAFVAPLGIRFKVDSTRRVVTIFNVWAFRQRSK
jgi:hypothetical protein